MQKTDEASDLMDRIDQLLYDADIAVYTTLGEKGKDINEQITQARIALVQLDRLLRPRV